MQLVAGGAQRFRNAQFIARVRAQRIMCHQLRGDLIREPMIQATPDVDGGQFPMLCMRTTVQFILFPCQICLFRISL